MSRTINALQAGEISDAKARTVGYLASILSEIIKDSDTEARSTALEGRLSPGSGKEPVTLHVVYDSGRGREKSDLVPRKGRRPPDLTRRKESNTMATERFKRETTHALAHLREDCPAFWAWFESIGPADLKGAEFKAVTKKIEKVFK